MKKIIIKKNELIDLIFCKKIECDGYLIEIDEKTMDILNEIEEKMIFGRSYRKKEKIA